MARYTIMFIKSSMVTLTTESYFNMNIIIISHLLPFYTVPLFYSAFTIIHSLLFILQHTYKCYINTGFGENNVLSSIALKHTLHLNNAALGDAYSCTITITSHSQCYFFISLRAPLCDITIIHISWRTLLHHITQSHAHLLYIVITLQNQSIGLWCHVYVNSNGCIIF